MQRGCHYIWRLDQYKRRWKKENPSSMVKNWWAFAFRTAFQQPVCVCVCVCVCVYVSVNELYHWELLYIWKKLHCWNTSALYCNGRKQSQCGRGKGRKEANIQWNDRGQKAGGNISKGIVHNLQLERLTFKLGSGNPKVKAQHIFRFV